MRILIVNHFPLEGSGSGIYTKNLARELSEMGHTVKVIIPEHQTMHYDKFEVRTIVFKGPETENPDIDFNFPCFTSHPRSVNTYYDLTDNEMMTYINTFVEVTKEEVDRFKPDIIHAQHLWITPYAAAQTGVPYIVTAHGTDLKGFVKDDRYHKYALEGAHKASKIITISDQVDEEVSKLYKVEDEKKALVMNGYDENLFFPNGKTRTEVLCDFGIEGEAKNLVSFAGKFANFKGIDVLLKAAKIYEEKLNNKVMTVLAGNGELFDDMQNLKQSLDLKNVHFLGHVTQDQLVDLYNIADVSTVPSRTEPFGLVAIEALACGTTVVGTNQGGLPDFINDDIGTLVPVEDHEALAEAIYNEIVRTDSNERAKRAANYAIKNFSWKKSISVVEKIYEAIVGN